MKEIISGIQQVGIGVPDLEKGFSYYKETLGMDIRMFDDNGVARIMLPYTGGRPQNRHAVLSINLKGGGGFEVWQYTTRTPQAASFTVQLGDLGIFICKIKSADVAASYEQLRAQGVELLGEPSEMPTGDLHFYFRDTYGNVFEMIGGLPFFSKGKRTNGGVAGVSVGVSDIDASVKFYSGIFGYDKVLADRTGVFDDLAGVEGGKKEFRRVLLTHSQPREGSFSHLLGPTHVELFRAVDYKPRKIFDGRQWGDLGFIHMCFDVKNLPGIKARSTAAGYPFTVDSGDEKFDMGVAAGHFAYVEDPDGTLIELVETFRIPVIKKLGIYLDLTRRDPRKALPDRLLKLLKYV